MAKRFQLRHMITVLILALTLAVTLPTTMSVDAAGAKLNKTKVTVCAGKTYTLKMSGVSKNVKWSTSDKKVVSISKKSGQLSENCTIKANKKGTATVTAKVKVGKKTKTFKCKVTVKGHSYSKSSYAWNKDFSKCTATKSCSRCKKALKQTVKASSKVTTKATCTEKGKRTYTAKFTKYDFGTKKKNVSIKALGHTFSKATYTWANDASTCTAKATCSRCNASMTEKATVTSVVTKQATKDTEGVMTYTATFTNKGFATQTKDVVIPKVVYLDQTSVFVRSDRTATVKVVNDTIASVSSNHGKIKCTNDSQSVTIKTTDKLGDAKGVVSITTTNGTVLRCDVVTEFTPGTEYVGQDKITSTYARDEAPYRYCAYGDLKGTWTNESYLYKVKCQTRAEYDVANEFYSHQTLRDGSVGDLGQKAQETDFACMERRNYKSKARLEWEALSYEVQENTYGGDFFNYIREKYGEIGVVYHLNSGAGFQSDITSNAQLKQIVDDWTKVSGEVPSWYYYTVFSDWAEWSGRDIGMLSYPAYDENLDFYTYTPPALPSNYKD